MLKSIENRKAKICGLPLLIMVLIDSAVMMLHVREMSRVCVDFVFADMPIHPFLFHGYLSQFRDDFNA